MSIPPRHLWRGGQGGEVSFLGATAIAASGNTPPQRAYRYAIRRASALWRRAVWRYGGIRALFSGGRARLLPLAGEH